MQTQMDTAQERPDAALPKLPELLLGRAAEDKGAAGVPTLRSPLAFLREAAKVCFRRLPKRLLGYAAQIALLVGAFAQSTSPTLLYSDFSPLVKGISVDADHCYFWLRQPGPNDVHTACYLGGALIKNMIDTLSATSRSQNKSENEFDLNTSTIKWCFTLGTFTLSVTLPDGTTPLTKSGTF